MDPQQVEQIRALCAGKSVEEVEQMLLDSRHAARIPDAAAVAQYIVDMCAADTAP